MRAAFILCWLFSLSMTLNAQPHYPPPLAQHLSAAKSAFYRSDFAGNSKAFAEARRVSDSLHSPEFRYWLCLEEAEAAYFLLDTKDSLPELHARIQAHIAAASTGQRKALLHTLSALLHLRSDQVEAARLDLAQAARLVTRSQQPVAKGPSTYSQGLYALAAGLHALANQDYTVARTELHRAILHLELLPAHKRWHALAHREIGYTYDEFHNTDRAIAYGRQSTILHEEAFGRMHRQTAIAYARLGRSYIIVDYNDDALSAYQQSMDVLRAIYGPTHPEVQKAYNGLGNCYTNLKDSVRAEAAYFRALHGALMNDGPRSIAVANLYRNLGILYSNFNNEPLAREYWYKNIELTRALRGPHAQDIAARLSWIAESYSDQGLHNAALTAINASLKALTPFADTLGQCVGAPIHADATAQLTYARTLNIKGKVHLRRYRAQNRLDDLDCAFRSLQAGLATQDSVRMGFHGSKAQLADLDVNYTFLEAIIEVCIAQHARLKDPVWLDHAFLYMEKSKSNLLHSALRLSMVGEHGAGVNWVGEEKMRRRQIDSLELQAYERSKSGLPQNHPELVRLRREVFQAQERLQNFLTELESSEPQYYQLRYGTRVPKLAEVRRLLTADNSLLLEYFVGEKSTFLLALSPSGTRLLQFPTQGLDAAIEAFLAQFDGRSQNTITAKYNFITTSQALYTRLIHPVADMLAEASKLVIVPDGKLGYVPFEALLTETDSIPLTTSYKALPYLLRRHSVAYASSATAMRMMGPRERRKSEMRLMAFAPSFDAPKEPLSGAYAYANALEGKEMDATRNALAQAPLHYTSEEVQRISRYFKGEVYQGSEATESRFKQSAGNFNILHFATHGTIQDGNPLFSSIAFSPERNPTEDGILHTLELFDMHLPAELAVLSACNTGKGAIQRGEGVMSLARGFMYAGCPSIVMSLWSVDDAASASIMDEFYRQLSKGRDKDEALRSAKLNYLDSAEESKAHPYFWAAHVLIGDTSSFRSNYQGWAWAAIILAMVATIVIFEVRKHA